MIVNRLLSVRGSHLSIIMKPKNACEGRVNQWLLLRNKYSSHPVKLNGNLKAKKPPSCAKKSCLNNNKLGATAVLANVPKMNQSKLKTCQVKVCKRKVIRGKPTKLEVDVNHPESTTSTLKKVSQKLEMLVQVVGEEEERRSYEQLVLSLKSPFPNEYDLALSVCMRLSSPAEETKELNVIGRTPALLNMLLAHAGFYQDCGLRLQMQDTYGTALGMDFASFWAQTASLAKQHMHLLCECYSGHGVSEVENGVLAGIGNDDGEDEGVIKCCVGCQKYENCDQDPITSPTLPWTMKRTDRSSDKVESRVVLVGEILRNFSFEQGNALAMSRNLTLLRFLIVCADCESGCLPQIGFEIISNIAKFICVRDVDLGVVQLVHVIVELLHSTFLDTNDRFKVVRCVESVLYMAKCEDNRDLLLEVLNNQFYQRLFDLLTLRSDSFLLMNCLECILALTEANDNFRDVLLNVHGSVNLLISFVSFNASYPKTYIRREESQELEDPVTQTIRLTAALALRNLVEWSDVARRSLRRWEAHLAEIAMSGCNCCGVVAQVLYFINE